MSKLNAARMRTLTKPGTYGDGAGLYLQVRGPQNRSWLYRFKLHGKAHLMGLGTVGGRVSGRSPRRCRRGPQAGPAGHQPDRPAPRCPGRECSPGRA